MLNLAVPENEAPRTISDQPLSASSIYIPSSTSSELHVQAWARIQWFNLLLDARLNRATKPYLQARLCILRRSTEKTLWLKTNACIELKHSASCPMRCRESRGKCLHGAERTLMVEHKLLFSNFSEEELDLTRILVNGLQLEILCGGQLDSSIKT